MENTKKFNFLSLLIGFALVIGLTGCNKENNLVAIVFTNDIHCSINDNLGFARLKAFRDHLKKDYPYVELVDSGDCVEGSTYGSLSKGEIIVDCMNELDYKYTIFGNHEFNYGTDRLKYLVEKSEATYLNANIEYIGEKDNWINRCKAYDIVDYGNFKVGFLGICTPYTISDAAPTIFMDDTQSGEIVYNFCFTESKNIDDKYQSFYNGIQNQIDKMKTEGADYVVALAHLGDSSVSSLMYFNSSELVKNVKNIDVILDGHSHNVVNKKEVNPTTNKEVIIAQTGTKLENVGLLTIGKNGMINVELKNNISQFDNQLQNFIDSKTRELDEKIHIKIGDSNVELPHNNGNGYRYSYHEESTIGNFVSDAIKETTNADIAFINGGGIRDKLPKGEVTLKDFISIFPFSNLIASGNIKGKYIVDMLEYFTCLAPTKEFGSFSQVSGIKFNVDASKEPNVIVEGDSKNFVKIKDENQRRVSEVQVLNDNGTYSPIEKEKNYRVGTIDYILNKGGCGMFNYLKDKVTDVQYLTGKPDYEILEDYFKKLNGDLSKYKKVEGRININI